MLHPRALDGGHLAVEELELLFQAARAWDPAVPVGSAGPLCGGGLPACSLLRLIFPRCGLIKPFASYCTIRPEDKKSLPGSLGCLEMTAESDAVGSKPNTVRSSVC